MDANVITDQNKAVFEKIVELVTSSDFQSGVTQFLTKHMDTFDDEEENKLEYSTIHEEYVTLLEQIIDSKLFQDFPEPTVKAFYSDFANNFKSYEQINPDTVETLFGFTDFNKFKEQVLELKKS